MKQKIQTPLVKTDVQVFYMKTRDATSLDKMTGQYTVNKVKATHPYQLQGFECVTRLTIKSKRKQSVEEIAEKVFAQLNVDGNQLSTPIGQATLRWLKVDHTSMSVGDFLIIDWEVIAVCKGSGWDIFPINPIDDVCDTPEMKRSIDEQMDRYAQLEQESQA